MKVPTYEQEKQIKTPQIATSTAGSPAAPGVVPAAFGGQMGEATENLGKIGSKIAESLLRMEVDKQDRKVLELETALMEEGNSILLNPEQEDVTIGDTTFQRSKGLLNRELSQAEGISEELNRFYEPLEKKYLHGLSKYQYDKLKPSLDKQFMQMRAKVSAHEYTQYEANIKNSVESNIKQRILDASIIRNSDELKEAIWGEQGAINSAKLYIQRFDEATQGIKNDEIAGDIIEAAVTSTLMNGDSVSAQKLLDSTKDKLSAGSFEKIQGKLNSGKKTLDEIVKRARAEQKVSNRFDVISKIASGEINWSNADNIIESVSVTDPELGEAIRKNIKSFTLEKDSNEDFMNLSTDIFQSDNSENISNFLINVLDENKDISKDRLASLVYAAKKRVEGLQKGEGDFWKTTFEFIKSLSPLRNAIVLANTLKRANKENIDGKDLLRIADEENQKQITIDNPNRTKYKINDIIHNSKTGKSYKVYGYADDGEPLVDEIK